MTGEVNDRRASDVRIDEIEAQLSNNTQITTQLSGKVDALHVAMFAPNSDNDFQTPGVMTTMKKLDNHIDVLCNVGKWLKRLLVFVVTIVMPGLVSAYQMGWLK